MKIKPIHSLQGSIKPPGDKSISHRVLIMAGLADGVSEITGLSNGEDVLHTLKAMKLLGAEIEQVKDGTTIKVNGTGAQKIYRRRRPIYIGNSGTGIRLLTGILAGQNFNSAITGDKSIKKRPMNRIIAPLTQMGAEIKAREMEGDFYAPLQISGRKLKGIEYELPVASAQVKGAILMAGLFAEGRTSVIEKVSTRAHTEEILRNFGVEVQSHTGENKKRTISLMPAVLSPARIEVPADPSAAAFWAVAASILPDSDILLKSVYTGTARTGFLEVLKRMGADLSLEEVSAGVIDIHIKSSELSGTDILPEEIPGLIDDIPILCIAAAYAEGTTRFFGAGELRYKESNRIEALQHGFNKLGGSFSLDKQEDTIVIEGTNGLNKTKDGSKTEVSVIDSFGDHRIAMAFAVAGMAAEPGSVVRIKNFKKSVETSYPDFLEDLSAMRVSKAWVA